MKLTAEQIAAIKNGEPVRLAPVEVREDRIAVRADIDEHVQLLSRDDDEFRPREMYSSILKKRSGGVACAQPPANRCDPSGVETQCTSRGR